MTRKEYDRRQALIADGRCPRCGKPLNSWPLVRPDTCWGKNSDTCPRWMDNIRNSEMRIVVR